MKKTILLSAMLFLLAHLAVCQTVSYKNLLGKWEGVDEKNKTGSIEFLDSTTMSMSAVGSPARTLQYTIDFTHDPAPMDLYRGVFKNGVALKCLIHLVDANTLRWQVFPDGQRPDKFDEGAQGTLIVLKRKKG